MSRRMRELLGAAEKLSHFFLHQTESILDILNRRLYYKKES